jgi:hypothetical protein
MLGKFFVVFSIPMCSGSECGVVIKLFSETDMVQNTGIEETRGNLN